MPLFFLVFHYSEIRKLSIVPQLAEALRESEYRDGETEAPSHCCHYWALPEFPSTADSAGRVDGGFGDSTALPGTGAQLAGRA